MKKLVFNGKESLKLDMIQKKLEEAKSPLSRTYYRWLKCRQEKKIGL